MPLFPPALDIGGEAIVAAITHATIHSAAPDATGSNQIAGTTRVPIDLNSTDGNITLASPISFTGAPPAQTVHSVGFHTAASGGTFLGYATRVTGDAAANASGEFNVTAISIPATAT